MPMPTPLSWRAKILAALPGVDRIVAQENLSSVHLATRNAGQALLMASPNAWFAHDWWLSDAEKPQRLAVRRGYSQQTRLRSEARVIF